MNTLITEILACLFAAAFLSLFIGWAIRSVLASREIKAANAEWETKQSELELRYKQDTEQLEEQVEKLGEESKQLANRNQSISDSLRENEIGVHKARADAIELNRQQAETQERLQRIIARKDEELKAFQERAAAPAVGAAAVASAASMDATMEDGATDARIATLSAKREAWERERQRLINNIGDDQATVAIDPADVPAEPYDRTQRIRPDQVEDLDRRSAAYSNNHELESDRTMTLDDDQTIALDDKNLSSSTLKRPVSIKPTPGGTPGKHSGEHDD